THDLDISSKSNRTGRPKLDDAETIILMAGANREDGVALPLPDSISAPADQIARKIKRLIKLSFLQEVPAKLEDGWRTTRGSGAIGSSRARRPEALDGAQKSTKH